MFHQSGGCCDGSSPMCFPDGEFSSAAPTCTSATSGWTGSTSRYWRHTHLTVDVVPGRGSGFSVEGPDGVRFLIRSRLLTDEEVAELAGV